MSVLAPDRNQRVSAGLRVTNIKLRRVVIVSHSSNLYGAGRSLLELVRCLTQRGLEISVLVSAEGMLAKELRRLGHTVWCIPLSSWVCSGKPASIGQADDPRRCPSLGLIKEVLAVWRPPCVST